MQCLMPLLFCLPGLAGQPDIVRQLSVIVHAYMVLCIHTKLHGHGHCRCDWTVTGEMLPMVKIRVPRPKGLRCIWLECIRVCHTEDAGRLHEAHNARVEIAYYVRVVLVCRDEKVLAQSGQWAVSATSKTLVCSKPSTSVYLHGGKISHAFWKCRFVSL